MKPLAVLRRKAALRLSLLVAVVLFALWLFRPESLLVETAAAVREPLSATVTAEGRSRVRDLYVVTAPVDGNLERIAVEAGDSVSRGGVVARIAPPAARPLDERSRAQAVAAVAAARAEVAAAEATAREAAAALTHAESLLASAQALRNLEARNVVEHAQHEVEIRRGAADAAGAGAEQARADLSRAEAVLGTAGAEAGGPATAVRSPVGGRVLRVVREDAGPVAAGTSLLEIGNVARLEFVADFLTSDAMAVRAGAAATISDWGPGGPIAARVRRIEPGAFTKVSPLGLEEQRVNIVLDPVGPPPSGLGNDFHVNVSVVVWNGANVLAVPSTALFRSGDRWAVFAVRGGRAHLTPVTPGPSDGLRTAIEQGLPDGARVIVEPSDQVNEGVRVRSAP